MPNPAIADLVARSLAEGVVHPGDGQKTAPFVLPLGIFRKTTMPPEMADQFAKDAGLPHGDIAKLTAEAIVNTIETAGNTIIATADLEALRARADQQPAITTTRPVTFHCKLCDNKLFTVAINPDNPRLNAPQLAGVNFTCPHTPIEQQP